MLVPAGVRNLGHGQARFLWVLWLCGVDGPRCYWRSNPGPYSMFCGLLASSVAGSAADLTSCWVCVGLRTRDGGEVGRPCVAQ